jgi:hypothetical protein
MRIFSRALNLAYKFCKEAKEPVGDVYLWAKNVITKLELPEKARRVSIGEKHTAIVG